MTTEVSPSTSVTKAKRGKLTPAECWHQCPIHAAMYPGWPLLSDADQIEIGVMWQHPVDEIAKIDEYEKVCPSCREEQRAKHRPVE